MTDIDATVTALSRFADAVKLPSLPQPVVEDGRRVARSALLAGCSAATTTEGQRLHAMLTGIDRTCSGIGAHQEPAGRGVSPAVFGSLGDLSRSRSVAFNGACLSLSLPAPVDGRLAVAYTTFAAAVAATQLVESDGATMLTGLVVGTEIGLRLGRAIEAGRPGSGWAVPTVVGRISAAVAVVKILGGGIPDFLQAIGIGATQAAGLTGRAEPSAVALVTGQAACDGFEAGVLALTGWAGPTRPLDGNRGFFRLLTGGQAPDSVHDGLGDTWLLADSLIGRAAHDAVLDFLHVGLGSLLDAPGPIDSLSGADVVALMGSG